VEEQGGERRVSTGSARNQPAIRPQTNLRFAYLLSKRSRSRIAHRAPYAYAYALIGLRAYPYLINAHCAVAQAPPSAHQSLSRLKLSGRQKVKSSTIARS
jgi:hypothetical protein